jgi:hypothetical protein
MDTTIFTHYIEKEEDVLSLIRTGTEENMNLDYKACDSLQQTDPKKKEISKDVSAFANSDGGTIIYGVIEEGHVPINTDDGYDPNEITKEWLEQVINSRIKRRIDGILIKSIPLESKDPSKVIYAVHIPQSTTAHQAYDKRYYKRFNFESVPMEDYEIRDAMNRSKYPRIEPFFGFKRHNQNEDGIYYKLIITLKNKGAICADHTKFIIEMPLDIIDYGDYNSRVNSRVSKAKSIPGYFNEKVEIKKDDDFAKLSFTYSKPNRILFPDDEQKISFNFLYKVNNDIYDKIHNYKINWKLYADNAPFKSGCLLMKDYNDF